MITLGFQIGIFFFKYQTSPTSLRRGDDDGDDDDGDCDDDDGDDDDDEGDDEP